MEEQMNDTEHAAALKAKHSELDNALQTEIGRPQPDQSVVSQIKKQKLRIKDALAAIDGG
jgi:hypothetical protein